MKYFATLIMGVAIVGVTCSDQSDSTPEGESGGDEVRERQLTPEVVLQLKYAGGELNRVYLSQYRKGEREERWAPAVSDRTVLCADLCHSGLGGPVCGSSCNQMLPVGLQTALTNNKSENEVEFGEPRVNVCPTLCDNHLGVPLCQCTKDENKKRGGPVNWNSVCQSFCNDGYLLAGCPSCNPTVPTVTAISSFSRILSTTAGWGAWCDVQCRQGHGGAACNCDRTPFA